MPTRRPRHTITETPPVQRAIRRLRALDPGTPVDFKQLVIRGAETMSDELEARSGGGDGRRDAAIDEFLALRSDQRLDAAAGLALHETGWARDA